MKWLLLILMLAAWPGFAQTPPARKKSTPAAAPAKWPISSLAVEGTHNFSREQVLAIAGLKFGQVAGRPEFDAARDRPTASGAFEAVRPKLVAGRGGPAGFPSGAP